MSGRRRHRVRRRGRRAAPATSNNLAKSLAALPPPGLGPRVVVLVPAHNEAGSIGLALDSLAAQTRRGELVVVIADNCTDRTVEVVRKRADAVVLPTSGNTHKKAGALNQALARVLPRLEDADAVLVMDADSALDAGFLEAALARLGTTVPKHRSGAAIGGVGGTFRGGRGGGFVGMPQRNEYARYARDVRRLEGKVVVLTGTAAVFQVGVLRRVIAARGAGELPGGAAQVYDTAVLTEDNELTLALLHLGYGILSPKECLLETEVMTTWRALWAQRLRWKRGALENLAEYGFTPITSRYWGRQVLTHLGVLITVLYVLALLWSAAVDRSVHIHPIWLAVTLVFMAERVVTVRERGPVQMALASVIVVEMAFDFFLQAVQARAFWDTVTKSEKNW